MNQRNRPKRPPQAKLYLRKAQLVERYGCDERTIDRMTRDGRLPPATYLGDSRFPLWSLDELDRNDRTKLVERA